MIPERCGTLDSYPYSEFCGLPCGTSHDCSASLWCMFVGGGDSTPGTSVCSDETHCAFLDSDTECAPIDIDGVAGCSSNARWQILAVADDPGCGRSHEVARCMTTPDGGCVLTRVTTYDVAHP